MADFSKKKMAGKFLPPDSLEVYKKIVGEADKRSAEVFQQTVTKAVNDILNKVVPRLAQKMASRITSTRPWRYQSATFVYRGAPDEELV